MRKSKTLIEKINSNDPIRMKNGIYNDHTSIDDFVAFFFLPIVFIPLQAFDTIDMRVKTYQSNRRKREIISNLHYILVQAEDISMSSAKQKSTA